MNYTKLALPRAISVIFAASVVLPLGAASAQSGADSAAATATPKTLDGVQVTGSRIRQTDTETSQPIQMISRQDIESQGFHSVGDILQNISAAGAPPLSRTSPSSSGSEAGGTYISLRDLGPERSLVLLNGRRMGIGVSGRADLSLIPAAAVERVEVLKDGASSIYGSDAIAGVINIITRTNFEGTQASAYYGMYGEGDGAVTKGDLVMGFTGDRGSLTMAAEWSKEDRVAAADRDYSRFPRSTRHPTDGWSTTSDLGGFVSTKADGLPNVTYSGNTRVMLRQGGDPRNRADYINQNLDTGRCASNSLANPGPGICAPGSTAGKFNPQWQADGLIPRETKSLYVDGMLDIADNLRFRTNLLYSDRSSTRYTSGRPLQAKRFPIPVSRDSYFNPLNRDIADWWRRTEEVARQTTNDLTTYRFSGAFEGDFEVGGRIFDWDVSYLNNRNELLLTGLGDMGIDRLASAVGPSFLDPVSGKVVCGRPGAPIAGCVPLNPFIPYGTAAAGGLTDNSALQDYLFHIEHDTGLTTTRALAANLSGSLFTLPAGDLGFAIGAEQRKEYGEFIPDALSTLGGSTNQGDNPTRGGYSVKELYAELQVPILADIAFAKELTLNVASRYSDYNTFGETTNNKIGVKWRPIDSLMLRASVADGFRAPTIADMYAGVSETSASYTDPCDVVYGSSATNATTRANCARDLGAAANTYRQLTSAGTPVTGPNAASPVPLYSGSNPALQPEVSRSKTIGVVWSPSFLSGFNLALDWWNVRITDTIVSDSPGSMLDDCYVLGLGDRCGTTGRNGFTRDPVTGIVNSMYFGDTNAGFREVEGYDLDLSYRFKTASLGDFRVDSTSTYMAGDYQTSSNRPEYVLSSTGWDSNFRIRSNLRLNWEKGAFAASWTARYFSGMKEKCVYFTPSPAGVPPVTEPHLECNEIVYAPTGVIGTDGRPESEISRRRTVGSTVFNDLQVRYQAPWDATVSVGVNNVFEKVGPLMYSMPSSGSVYYGGFDMGRFLYMRYTQRF